MRLGLLVFALLWGGVTAQASCIKNERVAQGLANLYVASRECPEMRPLDDEQYVLLLVAGGGIEASDLTKACGEELAPLVAVAHLSLVMKPNFCADIRKTVRSIPTFRSLGLLR